MASADLLVILLVGAVVGALAGLALGSFFPHGLYLGIVAGFLATIIAAVVRNTIMTRVSTTALDISSVPILVMIYAVLATFAGSAAAVEVARASQLDSPVWIGALAGLFSSLLTALLIKIYYMDPETGEIKVTRRK